MKVYLNNREKTMRSKSQKEYDRGVNAARELLLRSKGEVQRGYQQSVTCLDRTPFDKGWEDTILEVHPDIEDWPWYSQGQQDPFERFEGDLKRLSITVWIAFACLLAISAGGLFIRAVFG